MKETWINIMGDQPASAADRQSVTALQSRCPNQSIQDREWLEREMQSHALFPSISDPSARRALKQRIISQTCLIPTFRTFFQDILYLALLRKVLGLVLPSRLKHSVFETLSCMYGRQRHFETSYRSLWMSAMRIWPWVLHENPRQGHRSGSAVLLPSDGKKTFLHEATALGFQPTDPVPLSTATEPLLSPQSFVTASSGVPLPRRCGIPFVESIETDRETVRPSVLLAPLGASGQGISWLFVRRCFFVSFFGSEPFQDATVSSANNEAGSLIVYGSEPLGKADGSSTTDIASYGSLVATHMRADSDAMEVEPRPLAQPQPAEPRPPDRSRKRKRPGDVPVRINFISRPPVLVAEPTVEKVSASIQRLLLSYNFDIYIRDKSMNIDDAISSALQGGIDSRDIFLLRKEEIPAYTSGKKWEKAGFWEVTKTRSREEEEQEEL